MPSRHDAIETWTAGAQRVWRAAQQLATATSASELAVEHILWGLLSEENRAAEQLNQAGVTLASIPAEWGPPAEPVGPTETDRERGDDLPRHDLVEAVLIEARTEAFLQGPEVELGTEHLLIGLCRVPSNVSDWLNRFDVLRGRERSAGIERGSVASRRRNGNDVVTDHKNEEAAPVFGLRGDPARDRSASEQDERHGDWRLNWRDPTPSDLSDTYRILDAAANRAREGLRVAEDFVRWAWNDGFLSQQLKECRHEFADSLRRLSPGSLTSARDTHGDVGTEIEAADEYRRQSPLDVATASLKRVEEALRSLEEYSKVIDTDVARRFEQLRYRLYTLEKAILTTSAARLRLADQRLCLLATESLCHHGIGPAILESLEAGVRMVQLREKSLPDRELVALARRLRGWTKDFDALFIVNDRPDIAVLANADGVHVGQDDLTVSAARKIVGPEKLVGVSTHSLEQARRAVLDGADYLGVGPVFPSSTKTFEHFPGLDFVREAAEISLPWFAIGGITRQNVGLLRSAGAARIAVSGAICGEVRPGEAARDLLAALRD